MKSVDKSNRNEQMSLLDTEENCKKRIDALVKPKKKKIITLNDSDGIIESNLIEMPFITYAKAKELLTHVEYKWTDSNHCDHGIVIKGSVTDGVPTEYEFDVLVALFRIYAKKKKIEFNDENLIENMEKENLIIEFSLNEVAKELGHKRPNSDILDRVKKAIRILVETTIYNSKSGALYDIEQRKYLTNSEEAFHIIERYKSYSIKENGTTNRSDIQKVYLGEFFYKSIKKNYFKLFNFEDYIKLKSGIAKRLFLILNKWENNRDYICIGREKLYNKIPIREQLPDYKKRERIKLAAQRLIDIGYIKSIDFEKDQIKFIFREKIEQTKIEDCAYLKRYTDYSDIKSKLINVGIVDNEIDKYMNFIIQNFEYVKALLRYVDVQNLYSKINDEKKYIEKGLTEKYNIDEKYYKKI